MADPDVERGALLESQGDTASAEEAYARADQGGDAEGALFLGVLLKRRGDLVAAEDCYRRAEERGDPRASCNLAVLLEEAGDLQGAEAAYRRADANDFAGGSYGLGQLLYARGDVEGSIAANRRASELGDADAGFNLGILLKQRGDLAGAESAFAQADSRGHVEATSAYGRLLEERGDLLEAGSAYRRAEERGDPNGAYNLGALLYGQGEQVESIAAFKRAVAMGHPGAAEIVAGIEESASANSTPSAAGALSEGTPSGDDASDPALANAAKMAQNYTTACSEVLNTTNSCVEVANQAVGARHMADERPQHEISIANFTRVADERDQQFVPLYRAFAEVCGTARNAATNLLACQSGQDPELILMVSVDQEAYGNAATAVHILRSEFGPTPAAFLQGLGQANAAIQGDVFSLGEEGFQGFIWTPPTSAPSGERTCPWCAETIKAAAVICRFCGREVSP